MWSVLIKWLFKGSVSICKSTSRHVWDNKTCFQSILYRLLTYQHIFWAADNVCYIFCLRHRCENITGLGREDVCFSEKCMYQQSVGKFTKPSM